jgi:hypothetical protein
MKENMVTIADEKPVVSQRPRYLIFIIPPLIVFTTLLYIHLQVSEQGEEYTGRLLTLDRAFDLALALMLTGIAFCAGRAVCRLLNLAFDNAGEELGFSVMLGTGAIGLGVLLLGLLGLLSLLPVIVYLLLLTAAGHREIPALIGALKTLVLSAARSPWRIALGLAFLGLTVNLLLRAATPVHAFDDAIYHLAVAQKFADRGRVYPLLDNWAGNGPFLVQMVYVICLLAKAEIAAKLFNLILALLCALALYGFCKRFLSERAGWIAMFAFFGAGMVVEVAVTARIDVALAFVLFLATYSLMAYFETSRTGWLYASAGLAGISMGVKYTAGVWALLLALMYLVESFLRRSADFASVIKRGLLYAAIASAVAAPWFIKNAIWFHNPVYPFVTGEVVAPGSPPRYFNAQDEQRLDQFYQTAYAQDPGLAEIRKQELERTAQQRVERHPLYVWEYFTKPDLYNMAEEYHYPNYLFLLSPLLVVFLTRRWVIWLAVFSIIFFLAVTSTSWVGRILLPVYPALTIVTAYILDQLIGLREGVKGQKYFVWLSLLLIVGLVGAAVGSTAYQSFEQAEKARAFDFIAGKITGRRFMMSQFYYPPLDYINHQLPEDARVMMMGAQMSYGLRRPYVAEVNWDSTEWRRLLLRNPSFQEVSEDLKRQGITHILYSDSLFKWVALMGRKNYPNVSGSAPAAGPDYQAQLRNWTTFDIYSRNYLESVYSDQMGFILYKIK